MRANYYFSLNFSCVHATQCPSVELVPASAPLRPLPCPSGGQPGAEPGPQVRVIILTLPGPGSPLRSEQSEPWGLGPPGSLEAWTAHSGACC